MYNQLTGVVVNKPIAVIGKSIDQRSQMLVGGVYRDYLTIAEALENLTGVSPTHTAEIRKGGYPVFVTPAGVGQVRTTLWFKNGTADTDLVDMFPPPDTGISTYDF